MRVIAGVLALCMVLAWAGPSRALEASENEQAKPVKKGEAFPDIPLLGDPGESGRAYLGLTGGGRHSLSQVKAGLVIVEVFSMYCPHCQNEAPVANELRALLKARKLDGAVKMIGVGAGNSDFEVQVFREKYGVSFPLFEDPDFVVNKQLGEVGTPFFYVLAPGPGPSGYTVADEHLGRLPSARKFLDRIVGLVHPESGVKP